MPIHGICLVKNEDDIIKESLTFATRYCERIYVIDNGSTDETWTFVNELSRRNHSIVPFEQIHEPYGDWLRARVVNDVRARIPADDWWLILDADEFLAEDPKPALEAARRQGADVVNAWQIQFYFTERDLELWEQGHDSRNAPIFSRRRYYQINWQEPRLFRNQPGRHWDTNVSIKIPDGLEGIGSKRVLNRHYQFRDPEQIKKRLVLRYGHELFPHVPSPDWRQEVRDSRDLIFHLDGEPWHFSGQGLLHFYRRHVYDRVGSALRGGAWRRARRFLAMR